MSQAARVDHRPDRARSPCRRHRPPRRRDRPDPALGPHAAAADQGGRGRRRVLRRPGARPVRRAVRERHRPSRADHAVGLANPARRRLTCTRPQAEQSPPAREGRARSKDLDRARPVQGAVRARRLRSFSWPDAAGFGPHVHRPVSVKSIRRPSHSRRRDIKTVPVHRRNCRSRGRGAAMRATHLPGSVIRRKFLATFPLPLLERFAIGDVW
jgi:hypothetical protein